MKYAHISEFGFSGSAATANLVLLESIKRILEQIQPKEGPDGLSPKEAIAIGENLFHIEDGIHLAQQVPGQAKSYLSTSMTYLNRLKKVLEELNLTIINHTGTAYPTSVNVEILEKEEDPTLERDIIKETIEPSIYFNGALVKAGKVIVAVKK